MQAFSVLAEQLPPGAPPVELTVFGGAAMVLLFGARESTKDVDAFCLRPESEGTVREAAAVVAATLGLPGDWLNDAVKGYVHGLAFGQLIVSTPTLRVRTASVEQLLAMKLSAWRDDVDVEDARRLLEECAGTREEIWGRVAGHLVPGRELKSRYAFDDLWESDRGSA